MKRRLLTLLLVLGMSAALLSGCGGSSDEKAKEQKPAEEAEATGQTEEINEAEETEKKEQEELSGWIREAVEKHIQTNLWGANSKTIAVDVNGKEKETQSSEKTMDNEKQIIMLLYHFDTNDQTTFWTKEGDKVYQYEETYSADSSKKPHFLKISCKEDEAAYYESEAKNGRLPFESDKRVEVVGYDITNEGEDGDTVKIKIAEQSKINTDEFFEKVTKESVMDNYGWTEDDVKRVEGASEAIDAYVAENESNIAKNNEHVYESTFYYWLTKAGHELVKSEYSEQPIIAEYKAREKLSEIDAKIKGYEMEENQEKAAEVKEYITTTEYVTGDKCAPIDNFPKDAQEVTREQWMNGDY